MSSLTKASSRQTFDLNDLDWDVMSVDSHRLGTIEEGDCETATQSSVSLPSNHKRSWKNQTAATFDSEEASSPSHSGSAGDATVNGDVFAFLGTSRINFSLTKCNVILAMVALVLLLAVGYKYDAFLISLIIFISLMIHVLIIWWLNDEGYFFPEREAVVIKETTSDSAEDESTAKSHLSLAKHGTGTMASVPESQSSSSMSLLRLAQV